MDVNRGLVLALGLALLLHAGASSAAPDALPAPASAIDQEQQWFRQQLASAHAMARAGQVAGASDAFARLLDDPQFATLPPADQRAALSSAGWMAVQQDRSEQALSLYRRAIERDDSDADNWYRVAMLEMDLARPDDGAMAFIEVVERWPHLLPNVEDRYIMQLVYRSTTGSTARAALLQALFDANWSGHSGGASEAWYELAVEAMDRGDTERARAAIRRISSPAPLVRLRSEKRFDVVMPDGGPMTAERAAQMRVEALVEHVALAPDDLEPVARLTDALLVAGRHDETMTVATLALEAIAAEPSDSPAFRNIDHQVWLMNNRAIALRRLGRTDEALTELQRAAQLNEEGEPNVNQALNLGVFFCSLARPDDALQTIDVLGPVNDFGHMVEAGVRHCAALQKGDRRGARKALAYLREHRSRSEVIYLEALIREDKLDTAAQYLRELLASSKDRGYVLNWMQDSLRPAPLQGDVATRAARNALLARTDVRDALSAVGRIAHYDLYLEGSMD